MVRIRWRVCWPWVRVRWISGRAPLLRVFIAAQPEGGGRWLALLQVHHLVQDHTGLEVLLGEVGALLEGRGEDLPVPLPFRNFVARARLGVSPAEHERFFAGLLGDVTESTAPFGLTDVHQDGTAVEEAVLALDDGLAGRLREQARRLGVSAATVFHTVWARVVAVTSGRDDVVFGTVLFGRMQAGAGSGPGPGTVHQHAPGPGAYRPGGRGRGGAPDAGAAGRSAGARACPAGAGPAGQRRWPGEIPLFTSLLNYRHTPVADPGTQAAPAGVDLLHVQERTNYPLTVSIDDTGTGFRFTVQAAAPVDPQMVCALLRTTTDNLVTAAGNSPPHHPGPASRSWTRWSGSGC